MADLSWINNIKVEDIPWWRNKIDTEVAPQDRAAWHSRFDEIEHKARGIDLSWINNLSAFERETLATRVRTEQQRQQQQQQPTPPQPSGAQRNAYADFQQVLNRYGLGSMAEKTWKYIVENGTENTNQLMIWLYEQDEFKTRFPALAKLQSENRAISPEEYINLERGYAQVMRSAGLDQQFFDNPSDFTELISNDVSVNEFQQRIEEGFKRVSTASPLVRDAFSRYFGVQGDNALAAFFIDPDRALPALNRMVTQSEIAAGFAEAGMALDVDYSARMADLGFDRKSAAESARRVFTLKPIAQQGINEAAIQVGSSPAVTAGGSSMDEAEQIAVESLLDVNVQEQLERRANQRRAAVAGQPQQVVTTRTGRTSLG